MNKMITRAKRGALWAAVMLLAGAAAPAVEQAPAPPVGLDPQAIVRETQQVSQTEGAMTLAWWIPIQFWEATLAGKSRVPTANADAILKALGGYTMLAVMDAKIGALGKMDYTPADALAAEVKIKDAAGNVYTPIPEDQLEGDTRTVLRVMSPILTNMLGALGENVRFFMFPARAKNGQALADATREGLFYVEVGETEFRWRLPLGSVLPAKICPVCKESLSGSYKYCPYDGTKLPDAPAAAAKHDGN
jgi:hypothetical protein